MYSILNRRQKYGSKMRRFFDQLAIGKIVLLQLTGILFSASLLLYFGSCARSPAKDFLLTGDYKEGMLFATDLMCDRMLTCFAKITHTLSEESREMVNREACVASARKDLDKKLALHDPLIKMLSQQCFTAVIHSPCETIAETAFWDPSCIQLKHRISRLQLSGGPSKNGGDR